jgi:Ca-activated chloride channel family protein
MRLLLLINLSLLLLTAQTVCAQLAPADDFFNSGAQFYISNNIPAAKERVESGLKVYPNDEKLKKLEELLKQQSQQQQQKNQQQNQQQKNQQNQKSQSQNNSKNQQNQQQQQNSQSQKKEDQQKQNQERQKKEDQQKSQPEKPSEEKKNGDEKNQAGENQPVAPGQMTPQEAKRLLDSQKGNEKLLQLKPPEKPESSQQKIKDW